jgi:hypothetical protein
VDAGFVALRSNSCCGCSINPDSGVLSFAGKLRRTAAKLCRSKGGELEQIQFLLGHESILTTESYLGSEQDLTNAVNDALVFE